MIRLKNVSKFYYSKGVIATGFTKVNLEFSKGEFVAITGESGSGKSTLLNVISGLDSYEEGEMYINGSETSHYLEKDWEVYRRKYIGNIYQNFNLINSYTVYQNIDLILSLNGTPQRVRKMKIIRLLKKVGMLRYKNTKVSKLSGGQKQRVAIARALAKDVPVIIADEPTGSLDKKAAMGVIHLLKEISKDKLIIIVTHNYDQVEKFATRKITMHDGKVLEDKKILPVNKNDNFIETDKFKNINFFEKVRLGFRNTFNVLPKFVLLFLVYSFIVCALMGEYSYFKQSEYEMSKDGVNTFFNDYSDKRIVFNKSDKSAFTKEEIDNIKKIDNVSYVSENDLLNDLEYNFVDNNEENWLYGKIKSIDRFSGNVDVGRMPEAEDEAIICGTKEDYYLSQSTDSILEKDFYLMSDANEQLKNYKIKIVGIKYTDNTVVSQASYDYYVSNSFLDRVLLLTHQSNSKITINFMGTNYSSDPTTTQFKLEANEWVSPGQAFISEDLNIYCDKNICKNKSFNVNVKNIYYDDNKSFVVNKTYTKNTIGNILLLPNYTKDKYDEFYNGIVYINPDDYNALFNKGTYQMSVYVSDIKKIDDVNKALKDLSYNTLEIKNTLVEDPGVKMLRIVKIIVTTILVVVLFFISYFIIKIILKSRNTYYSVLRMLGASKGVCRSLLINELFNFANLSYFIFILVAYINKMGIINIGFLKTVNTYFEFNDYLVLYFILIIMSILISVRYSSKLFKDSVMNTYREEA